MKDKHVYLSLARIICAFSVIMIHTNECFYEFNVGNCWTTSNIIECGLGFAVPIFIMISGATLIDYSDRYSTKEYFKKRFTKTFIPYVFLGIIIGNIYTKATGSSTTYFIYFSLYIFLACICVYHCFLLYEESIRKEYLHIWLCYHS